MPAVPVSRRAAALGTSLAVVGGVLVATASAKSPDAPPTLVAAAETTRTALPAGSSDRSRTGLERTAVRLAAVLDAVPMREGDDDARFCPVDALRVQWSQPSDHYEVGAFVAPVGPAPTAQTEAVNGIVLCSGVDYAYMGFEARWNGSSWDVAAVPSLSDEHELHEEEPHAEEHTEEHADEPAEAHADEPAAPAAAPAAPPAPAPAAPKRAPAPAPAPASTLTGMAALSVGGIDPYARYDPQRSCDPVGKPGMIGLRDLLLRTYPSTRSLGVSRTCTARGVSEHKEGRAFDWGVNVGVASERAAAEGAISALLATDSAGNRHALARRLGVMYMIWNRQIWSAYSAGSGWRPYSGASPHTDHVHLSLSWDGAMGRTSFWRGDAASLLRMEPGLQLADPAPGVSTSVGVTGSGNAPGPRAPARLASYAGDSPARREEPSSRHEQRARRELAKQAGRRDREVDEELAGQGGNPAEWVAGAPPSVDGGAPARPGRPPGKATDRDQRSAQSSPAGGGGQVRVPTPPHIASGTAPRAERETARAAAKAERQADKAQRKAERQADKTQRKAERAAAESQRKNEREADKAGRKAERKNERKADKAQRKNERQADKTQRKAERAAAKGQRKADKDQRKADKAQRKAERTAAKAARKGDGKGKPG